MATHEMTTKPPSADRVARWRTQMTAEQREEFEADRRRPARRSSATRPAPTPSRRPQPRSKPRSFHRCAVGIVSKWFACGQAVVSRQIRSALDELGHETFVLAKQGKGPRAQQERVADPVWDQPGVTRASEADIPLGRVPRLGRRRTRSTSSSPTRTTSSTRSPRCARDGVRTIGRFVWESFAAEDAEPAKERLRRRSTRSPAPSRSATASSGSRARCSPGAATPSCSRSPTQAEADRAADDLVRFVVPGSFMGKRKPFPEIVEAFTRAERRPPAAADPRPGRPQGGQARARPPAATSGS